MLSSHSLPIAVHAEIVSLLQNAGSGEMLVKNIKQALKILKREGITYRMRILPSIVGVHPESRDGYGVNAADVLELAEDVFEIGFDEDEVKAVCGEASEHAEHKFTREGIANVIVDITSSILSPSA